MDDIKRKQAVKELARRLLDFADRKGWGIGECRWNLNRWALDEIEECDAYIGAEDRYDRPDADCSGDHAEHIRLARSLASEAYEKAAALQDLGVKNFD